MRRETTEIYNEKVRDDIKVYSHQKYETTLNYTKNLTRPFFPLLLSIPLTHVQYIIRRKLVVCKDSQLLWDIRLSGCGT